MEKSAVHLVKMGWLHTKTPADSVVLKVIISVVAHHVLVKVIELGVEVVQHVIEVRSLRCIYQ